MYPYLSFSGEIETRGKKARSHCEISWYLNGVHYAFRFIIRCNTCGMFLGICAGGYAQRPLGPEHKPLLAPGKNVNCAASE